MHTDICNENMETTTVYNILKNYEEYYNSEDNNDDNYYLDFQDSNCSDYLSILNENQKNQIGLQELNTEEIFTASIYIVLALVGIVCNGLVGKISENFKC